jgi:hypothetical protein
MFKKIVLLIMVLCVMASAVAPVHAAGNLTLLNSSAEVSFPQSINFKISAQSDAKITDIRLQYSIDMLGFAKVINETYISFQSATKVDTQWKWDLTRIGGLPPGTKINYQWLLKDANGNSVKSALTEVKFDDGNHPWKSIAQDKVTLYWYDGNQSFGQTLMQATQDALTRLSASTGATIKDPIRLYIYANQSDLLGSMIFPQEWSGGVAFTSYGCIAIGISSSNLDWGKGAIAHELTHLITAQATDNPYNGLPTWLDEGLAMYNQGPLDISFTNSLNNAIQTKTLITVRTLSSPFSTDAGISYLDYAESYGIVSYLITTYGKDKMAALESTFQQGSTYDGALQKVYGFDMDGLNTRWQATLTK